MLNGYLSQAIEALNVIEGATSEIFLNKVDQDHLKVSSIFCQTRVKDLNFLFAPAIANAVLLRHRRQVQYKLIVKSKNKASIRTKCCYATYCIFDILLRFPVFSGEIAQKVMLEVRNKIN